MFLLSGTGYHNLTPILTNLVLALVTSPSASPYNFQLSDM